MSVPSEQSGILPCGELSCNLLACLRRKSPETRLRMILWRKQFCAKVWRFRIDFLRLPFTRKLARVIWKARELKRSPASRKRQKRRGHERPRMVGSSAMGNGRLAKRTTVQVQKRPSRSDFGRACRLHDPVGDIENGVDELGRDGGLVPQMPPSRAIHQLQWKHVFGHRAGLDRIVGNFQRYRIDSPKPSRPHRGGCGQRGGGAGFSEVL